MFGQMSPELSDTWHVFISLASCSSYLYLHGRSASMFAEPKVPFTQLKEVTGAWRRDKTIVSPHGEVDVSDHSPDHHHSDLVYGNHLSTEQTPPAHHRGIFQRL